MVVWISPERGTKAFLFKGRYVPQPPCPVTEFSADLTSTLSWLGWLKGEALWSPRLPAEWAEGRSEVNFAFSPSPALYSVSCHLFGCCHPGAQTLRLLP